jgi:hypothetical protein
MRIFSEEDSRLKKGVVVIGGLAAAAMLFVLAGAFFTPSHWSPAEPAAAKRAKRPPANLRSPLRGEPAYAQAPVAVPTLTPMRDEAKLARAMDQSTARQLVRMLVEAAATGDPALKASMIGTLGRLPVSPRPILESELARAASPSVRGALEEALARVK